MPAVTSFLICAKNSFEFTLYFESWNAMRTLGHWMPVGGVEPVPPGTTVADVVADVGYMMSRNATLRTKLVSTSDGLPTQEVFAAGATVVEVYE